MIYAGCDLGTISAKVVLIEDGHILAAEVLPYKSLPRQAAAEVFVRALAQAGLVQDRIAGFQSTGFGKKAVPFAHGEAAELICLHRAVRALHPAVRTVIDVGGQSIRAFNIDSDGRLTASTANEKCSAGTGKFMEVMAQALEMPLEELSRAALSSTRPLSITSQCGVFAESEVITHVNEGHDRLDIFAGISLSVAGKVAGLVRRISLNREVVLVGGVAKNLCVVRDLERELQVELIRPDLDPQVVSAYGAALLARDRGPG
jgi:predicted CoA-substrate-specific enzyme activase